MSLWGNAGNRRGGGLAAALPALLLVALIVPAAASAQTASSTTSQPSASSITIGASVTDTATVTGTAPTGTVDFSVCGPLASATGCPSGGVSAGSANLGLTGSATSPSFTPTAPGTWCFAANYQGDTLNDPSGDDSPHECFTVTRATSTTSSSPTSSSIALGGSNTDTVTVTGSSAGGTPTGAVDFSVCGPGASSCASGGSLVGSAILNGSGQATSRLFTPGSAGEYCFRADYQGDGNYQASSDGLGRECFTVGRGASSTSSAPTAASVDVNGPDTDGVTVTGNSAGGAPTGTVNFSVCGPLASATGCTTGASSVGSTSLAAGTGDTSTITSPSFTPKRAGTYCFAASYRGDPNYNSSADATSDECFTATQSTPTVTSAPQSQTSTESQSNSDNATVQGNGTGGSPTGTISFHVCGPDVFSCSTGGTSLGSPVDVSAGPSDTATASSPSFTPAASGTWCFRADYSGDTNYNGASDNGSGCFTVPEPGAPTAAISSPVDNAYFSPGQQVSAGYGCTEASGGPGIASCSGPVANGAAIDTSSLGPHSFTVVATSRDGLSTPVVVQYVVAAPPTATITSPKSGARYTLGQSVAVGFACGEGEFGPGLVSCVSPSAVNTNSLGAFSFNVTATSGDGQRTTTIVQYYVIVPSNRFRVTRLRPRLNGEVSFNLVLPGGGKVNVVEMAPRSSLPKPNPGSFVFAQLRRKPTGKKTLHLTLLPNAAGRALLTGHHATVRVTLTVTFTPTNGSQRTERFSQLRVSP